VAAAAGRRTALRELRRHGVADRGGQPLRQLEHVGVAALGQRLRLVEVPGGVGVERVAQVVVVLGERGGELDRRQALLGRVGEEPRELRCVVGARLPALLALGLVVRAGVGDERLDVARPDGEELLAGGLAVERADRAGRARSC
jgi:hypothetical protein